MDGHPVDRRALLDHLPDATLVVDHFHAVKLANAAIDEVGDRPVLHPRWLTTPRTPRLVDDLSTVTSSRPTSGSTASITLTAGRPTNSSRARSVEHSRGPANLAMSDVVESEEPLLRVWDPPTPLIGEAPD